MALILITLLVAAGSVGGSSMVDASVVSSYASADPVSSQRRTFGIFKKATKAVGGAIVDTAKTTAEGAADVAKSTAKGVAGLVNSAADTVVNVGNSVADATVDTTNAVVDGNPLGVADAVAGGAVGSVGAVGVGIVDASGAVGDGVVNVASEVKDGVVDTALVVGNHVKKTAEEIAESVRNCIDDLDECVKLNPIWGAIPSCLLEGKPDLCFKEPAELLARYAARFQKIASMAFWEVGEALLNLARDFGKRRFSDCSDGARVTNEFGFPVGARFKKKFPFIEIDTIKLEGCLDSTVIASDLSDLFSDCFMKSLRGLLPQVIAIWKDGEIGDYATCEAKDNFAVTIQVKLLASGMVKPPGMVSAGGSIGLAIGCDHGEERMEMMFGYQAGLKIAASTKVVDLQLFQQVGFLKEWPSRISKAFQDRDDRGHIEVNTAWPSLANPILSWLLNKACRDSGVLTNPAVDVLCRMAIPQSIALLFKPPLIDLGVDEKGISIDAPHFEPPKLVGAHMAWIMTLFEKDASGGKIPTGSSVTKNGGVMLKDVQPTAAVQRTKKNPSKWTSGSFSLSVLYGNAHVFGRLPDEKSLPCDGWKSWNVTVVDHKDDERHEHILDKENNTGQNDGGNHSTSKQFGNFVPSPTALSRTPSPIQSISPSPSNLDNLSDPNLPRPRSSTQSPIQSISPSPSDLNYPIDPNIQNPRSEAKPSVSPIVANEESATLDSNALQYGTKDAPNPNFLEEDDGGLLRGKNKSIWNDSGDTEDKSLIFVAGFIVFGVVMVGVFVAVHKVYSDFKVVKSSMQGTPKVQDDQEKTDEALSAEVQNPLPVQGQNSKAATWTSHICPESGDVYFYSDPKLGGTGETAWEILA